MKETEVAIQAAKEAGKIIMENFGKVHSIKMKSKRDFVTETDIQAEKKILGILKKEFPDYSVLAEESGEHGEGEMKWIVDPLDGTTNYSIGNPFFNVSIGLAKKTGNRWEIISGVVYSPVTGEVFSAEKGKGAFLNGEKISVSQESELSKLLLTFCHGNDESDIKRVCGFFQELKLKSRDFNRMRAGALELAFVAAGRIGAYISSGDMAWDSAAGSLLVREAGGRLTNFQGNEWGIGEKTLLATNGFVHEKIIEIIKGKETA